MICIGNILYFVARTTYQTLFLYVSILNSEEAFLTPYTLLPWCHRCFALIVTPEFIRDTDITNNTQTEGIKTAMFLHLVTSQR